MDRSRASVQSSQDQDNGKCDLSGMFVCISEHSILNLHQILLLTAKNRNLRLMNFCILNDNPDVCQLEVWFFTLKFTVLSHLGGTGVLLSSCRLGIKIYIWVFVYKKKRKKINVTHSHSFSTQSSHQGCKKASSNPNSPSTLQGIILDWSSIHHRADATIHTHRLNPCDFGL